MKKEIVINASTSETRIAILEDGTLVELYVERPENERMVGDIYKGKVENVVEAIQAAFVDVGLKQNGFLPFADVGDRLEVYSTVAETVSVTRKKGKGRGRGRHSREKGLLKPGQEILVQVTKEPLGGKGARLTTVVSLPGRFLVLVPNDQMVGVSRKIGNVKERRRLRRLAASLCPPGFGLIIRTVAEGKDVQTLQADLEGLLKTWKRIEEKAKVGKAPQLVYKDMGLASSVIRDLFSQDIDRLVVDSRRLYGEIRKYLKDVAPALMSQLDLYKKKSPIFDDFGIEEEIEKSLSRKVWLKSGGYIVFDQVEAMVVVDVNSGRSVGRTDHELNALNTDVEAARVIAQQLRLRDVGGIIVIDFIDLESEKHRKKVVSVLKRELNKDRAAFDVLPMSNFGLVELTRKRIRPSLLYTYSEPCPRCGGLGRVLVKSTIATKIERRIQSMKSTTGERHLVLRLHPDMADYMTDGVRNRIRLLMVKHFVRIKVVPDPSLKDEEFVLMPRGKEKKVSTTVSS